MQIILKSKYDFGLEENNRYIEFKNHFLDISSCKFEEKNLTINTSYFVNNDFPTKGFSEDELPNFFLNSVLDQINYSGESFSFKKLTTIPIGKGVDRRGTLSEEQMKENLVNFLGDYGMMFLWNKNNLPIRPKKSGLYIVGDTNTGKTQTLLYPLKLFYGEDQIAMLSKDNFGFDALPGTSMIGADEFSYNREFREEYLKLLNGDVFKINVKYHGKIVWEKDPGALFMTNYTPSFYAFFKDDAIRERVNWYRWDWKVVANENVNTLLKKEFCSILLISLYFCLRKYKKIPEQNYYEDMLSRIIKKYYSEKCEKR